jgi:hypothetical protein
MMFASSAWAIPSIESILPEDTDAILKIDLDAMKDHPENPLSEIFNDETILTFYSFLLQEGGADFRGMNDFYRNASAFIERDAAVVLEKLYFQEGQVEPDALIILGYNGDESAVLNALQEAGSKHEQTEGYRTYSMYSISGDDINLRFIFTENYIFISSNESSLHHAVDDLLDGVSGSFEQSEAYSYLQHKWERNDFYAYVDLKDLGDGVNALIRGYLEPGEGESVNMMMPLPQDIINALKMNELDSLYWNCSLETDQVLVDYDAFYNGSDGVGVLLDSLKGTLEYPSFVPDDASYVTFVNYDLSRVLESVESMIQRSSPLGYALYQQYLMQYNEQMGINIRDVLLNGFGDDYGKVYLGLIGSEFPLYSSLQYFRVNDAEKVQAIIDTYLNSFDTDGAFVSMDYNGTVIYDLSEEGIGLHTQFAIIDNWFVVGQGDADLLQNLVDMEQGSAGSSAWDIPELREVMDSHPHAVGYAYSDFDSLIPPYLKMLYDISDVGVDSPEMEDLLEKASYPYYMRGYVEPGDGVVSAHYLIQKK